jgi:hypothetical protein
MSIFGSIMSAIFGTAKAADSSTPISVPPSEMPATQPMSDVDVAAVLSSLAEENPEELDWEKSIVDLMKLLDLDASLTARKSLATELGYEGDMHDSAAMNIWLHKQVMIKLAANGGKVPADLQD